MRHAAAIAAAAAALLLAGAAGARDPSPTEIKLNDIDVRLGRVEAVVNNQSLLEMARRIDELETQLRSLRGAQEEAQNGSDALRKQQRDLYADLDRRLTALETAVRSGAASAGSPDPAVNVAGRPAATGSAGAGAGVSDEQAAYNRAFDTLKGGNYGAAIGQWQDFQKAYPNSRLQENAQYWLGESFYVTRDYDAAMSAFKTLVDHWPDSAKAPDALLKLGYSQYEKKRTAEARATLQQVQARYPGTDAARLAADRLDKIGNAAR